MDGALRRVLKAALTEAAGADVRIVAVRPVGGGCIHAAEIVELADGRRLFVKHNRDAPSDMFEAESAGLAALAAPGVVRVPGGIQVGQGGGARFLAMEAIELGSAGPGFAARFGCALADLHRATIGDRFGFDHDNYIGSTPQPNGWMDDWVEFWRSRRLGFQLRLARRSGLTDAAFDQLGDRLLDRLEEWIDPSDEPACLLHGDLWGGNYLVDSDGEPVLIDPAVYHGHREADLAMTLLFGGFPPAFHDAYREAWPLPPGSEQRLEIYKLYHLLNHLNLFGGSYRSSCVDILRSFR